MLGGSPDFGQSKFPSNFASAPVLQGSVGREQAIRHALTYSPSLQSQRAELRALEAEIVQAGLPPNPELGFDVENFAGNGGSRGFNGAEITAALSQKLELGGKRSKRSLVAALEAEALRAEIASDEREIRIATDRAFTTLLEARQVREFSEQNLARAEENRGTLDALLEAGKSTRIDVGKATLAVSEAKELLAESRSAESNAAAELSQTWGGGAADVTAAGSLSAPGGSVPSNPEAAIKRHPAMRAAALRFARAQATYDLEKAKRYSDVEVGGGVRQLRDADETAAVVGVRVPLPIFDRNQGNIQAAKERLDRANAEGRSTESELRTRLARLSADLRAARSRASEFDSRTINAARQGLDDTREAYSAGKASLLEVLDARETLFEVERGQARALADLLRAHNSLKTLTTN
ncbi:cobalt-zinc-cadmium resistance protein CzcC [Haloferula sargassicola]|uniref:Cobalt-zinc-cadmium resistance protein CzcC n=2 Tax=Haloferula sargassicola TaxID=490096 RepID=A0ABP9UVN3_9BACT